MGDLNRDPGLILRYELPSTQAFAEAPTFSLFNFAFSIFQFSSQRRKYVENTLIIERNISDKPSLLKWENKVSRR